MKTILIFCLLCFASTLFSQDVLLKTDKVSLEGKLLGLNKARLNYTLLLRYSKHTTDNDSNVYDYAPRTGQSSFTLVNENFEVNRPIIMFSNNLSCSITPAFYLTVSAEFGCFTNKFRSAQSDNLESRDQLSALVDKKIIVQSAVGFGYRF